MSNVIAINAAAKQSIAAAQATSDEMLLASIAKGDRTAMHVLYSRHNVRVYRFVLRMVRDTTMAEDLVSQVFLDVVPQARALPILDTWVDIEETLTAELQRALYGQASVAEAIQGAAHRGGVREVRREGSASRREH